MEHTFMMVLVRPYVGDQVEEAMVYAQLGHQPLVRYLCALLRRHWNGARGLSPV